jgi:hypothetical protein
MARIYSLARRATPVRVALAVLCLHLVWIVAYFAAGHEVRDFIKIGPKFVASSDASDVIRIDPDYDYPPNHDQAAQGLGFDGQFTYYIALDPSRAHRYIDSHDEPAYRYQRILYPILARFTALGQPSAVPWTMLAINLLSVGLGVLALGSWLRRKGISSLFATLYGLYPGLLVALQRDLTEPLAYGLVACAVYLFDFGGWRGVLGAGSAFGAAALARETTIVFAVLFAVSILAGRPNASEADNVRDCLARFAVFSLLALVPVAIWTLELWSWLGTAEQGRDNLTAVPFGGIFENSLRLARQPVELVFVALPAVILATVAAPLRTRPGRVERLCLIANVLAIIVFASGSVWVAYTSIGRVSVAVVLAALLCLPYLLRERPAPVRTLLVAWGLLMALFPIVLAYGFSTVEVAGR